MNKKARQGISVLIPLILTFGVIAIMIGMSSFVLSNIKDTQTPNTTEHNATESVSEGIETFASLFPALGVIVGAIILLVIIVIGFRKLTG
jgi:uncharacterized membrane protein